MVGEGETVEDINFALVPGGVITGKITDSDGQPLIEESVQVARVDGQMEHIRFFRGRWIHTDDRGVYRAFGLRPGKYKVSAGATPYRLYGNRQSFKHTFHPSTTDETKATVIEVSEGSEIKNVDIVMAGRAASGFKVSGRIIDGITEKPLSNIVYGLTHKHEGGTSSMSGSMSNADGEFKLDNVAPGNYSVYIQPPPDTGMRANPISFEVTDRDITGLTIKTSRAASLSGIVVLESNDGRPLTIKPDEVSLHAFVESSEPDDNLHSVGQLLKADGTFKIYGLRGGTAHISLNSNKRSYSDFVIIRVERDGFTQPNKTINLKEGEQVEGLRVIVNQFTGVIRGQVKIEDGELPSGASLMISITFLDDDAFSRSSRGEQADSRGRFHADGLKAGRYEVEAGVFWPGPQPRFTQVKKEVTVTDNAVTEVFLTLKLNP
jgi:hypothetical protein